MSRALLARRDRRPRRPSVLALLTMACCKREAPPPPPTPVAQAAPSPPPPEPPPQPRLGRPQVGFASWYGRAFADKRTASGERFDPDALTAAHRTLPLGSTAKVTNSATGRSVQVRVNDRGPYRHGRIIDLSRQAAMRLGMIHDGVAQVRVQLVVRPSEG